MKIYFYLFLILSITQISAQNFSVTNIRVEQRGDGSFFVDIFYDLSLVTSNATVTMQASSDNGITWGLNCNNVTGAVGAGITAGTNKQIIWNFGTEHTNFYNEQIKVKIIADDGITPCPGTPTVTYAGKTYNTVLIGSQCWLKENLNVGVFVQSVNTGSNHSDLSNNGIIEKYCYNNDTINCNTYGGLYDWNEAMQYVTTPGTQGICPTGWHIPTYAELQTLQSTLGNDGNALKAIGQGSGSGAGTNTSGFSALLAGSRGSLGYFGNLGIYANFCSSTEYDTTDAYNLNLSSSGSDINFNRGNKNFGYSVRCVRDISTIQLNSPNGGENWQVGSSQNITWTSNNVTNVKLEYTTNNGTNWTTIISSTPASSGSYAWTIPNTPSTQCRVSIADVTNASIGDTSNNIFAISSVPINPCPGTPTVTYAGKTYNTVQIGDQCWLKENLDVGTMIPGSSDQTNNSIIEKYCYDNDTVNCDIYGGLYQWNEAMQYVTTPGTKGICPTGWHIPTRGELEDLIFAVNSDGNALKAIGQGSGSGAGTNINGFSALLAGYRDYEGNLLNLGSYAYFQSSTEYLPTAAYYLNLTYDGSSIIFYGSNKNYGYSVRCLKD